MLPGSAKLPPIIANKWLTTELTLEEAASTLHYLNNLSVNVYHSYDLVYCIPIAGEKLKDFLINLRYFRIFIGLWNIIMMLCMVM